MDHLQRVEYLAMFDKRSDYITNEVAIDYNAGFQSAVAALLSLNGKSCV